MPALCYCLLLYRAALAPCAVSAPMPRCRFGVAPYIWPQSKTQNDGTSSFLTCFHPQPLKSTDGQPRTALQSTAPSNPSTQPRQHQKSVIERSKQSSVHTLMHKKKDRVSSAGSRQSQRAGPTRACAAPASNPLGVSSKICDHHEKDATLRPRELAAM